MHFYAQKHAMHLYVNVFCAILNLETTFLII